MSDRFLEKNLLNKVDELIEILIFLSKKDADYENQFKKCMDKIEEIIPLILQLIKAKRFSGTYVPSNINGKNTRCQNYF